MKKSVLALLLVTVTCFAYAQTTESSNSSSSTATKKSTSTSTDDNHKLHIGLQVSPSLTWMKSQDNVTSASKVGAGFGFGLMMDYNFTKNYAFSTGLYVALAPASLTYDDSVKFNSQGSSKLYPIGTTVNYSLEYIEIPISLKLKTNEIGYVTYFGQFGVEPGLNIKAKGDIKTSAPSGLNNVVDGNLNPDIGLTNLALLLGVGIEYSLTTSTSAYVSLNFVNGFIDVTSNPKNYKSSVTLNQLALRLGVFF